ncbi:MAG: hypothetical protein ACKVU1_16545 [bacterium]
MSEDGANATHDGARGDRRVLIAAAAATVAIAILLLVRFPWIVGPPSWRWPYVATSLWPRALGTTLLFALLAGAAATWTRRRDSRPRGDAAMLALVVLIAIALELSFLGLSPLGPVTLPLIHVVPWVTGYFWTARSVTSLPEMLTSFHEIVAGLPHHARTHPPGLVAVNHQILEFFRGSAGATDGVLGVARAFGISEGDLPGAAPAELASLIIVGLAVVICSRLALIPAFFFARRLSGAPAARAAVLLLAVIPSHLLFAGEFDAAYPLLILAAFLLVGRGRGLRSLVAAGALCGVLCLFTFVASFFLLLVGIVDITITRFARADDAGTRPPPRWRLRRLLALGAGFASVLALFQLATGCSIPRVFLAAYKIQHEVLIPEQRREWLTWVFWNLPDFFIFLGPAVAVLFAREVFAAVRDLRARRIEAPFTLAVLAFLAVLDLSGLIPAETSRVWLFLVAPVVIAATRGGVPGGTRGLIAILALQFAFSLVAKGSLLMIDVKLPG